MASDERIYLVEIFAESGLDRWRLIEAHEFDGLISMCADDRQYDKFNAWLIIDGKPPEAVDVTGLIDDEADEIEAAVGHAAWYSSPGTSGRI